MSSKKTQVVHIVQVQRHFNRIFSLNFSCCRSEETDKDQTQNKKKQFHPVSVCTVDCELWDALVQARQDRATLGAQVGQRRHVVTNVAASTVEVAFKINFF